MEASAIAIAARQGLVRELLCASEERFEHFRSEAARLRVVTRAMIAGDQRRALEQSCFSAVGELGVGWFHPVRAQDTFVSDGAERENHFELWQGRDASV